MQFTELTRVAPEILQATQAMGFTEMTEIQEKAIPLMLYVSYRNYKKY